MIEQQQLLEEFKADVQKAIEANGGLAFVGLFELSGFPMPCVEHLLTMVKKKKVVIVVPGPSEIL